MNLFARYIEKLFWRLVGAKILSTTEPGFYPVKASLRRQFPDAKLIELLPGELTIVTYGFRFSVKVED